MARAMGTNAYGKEPRRGERTLSRGFTHRRARRAFLRPYGAGASLGRSHRAYALGYFLVPLTGLRTEQPERAVLGLPAAASATTGTGVAGLPTLRRHAAKAAAHGHAAQSGLLPHGPHTVHGRRIFRAQLPAPRRPRETGIRRLGPSLPHVGQQPSDWRRLESRRQRIQSRVPGIFRRPLEAPGFLTAHASSTGHSWHCGWLSRQIVLPVGQTVRLLSSVGMGPRPAKLHEKPTGQMWRTQPCVPGVSTFCW